MVNRFRSQFYNFYVCTVHIVQFITQTNKCTTHTHTHIYIYIYIYMCVCVCVCKQYFVYRKHCYLFQHYHIFCYFVKARKITKVTNSIKSVDQNVIITVCDKVQSTQRCGLYQLLLVTVCGSC